MTRPHSRAEGDPLRSLAAELTQSEAEAAALPLDCARARELRLRLRLERQAAENLLLRAGPGWPGDRAGDRARAQAILAELTLLRRRLAAVRRQPQAERSRPPPLRRAERPSPAASPDPAFSPGSSAPAG